MELIVQEKELPSGITLYFADNTNLSDFFTYVAPYNWDSNVKLSANEFFCSLRTIEDYEYYTVIPHSELLKMLVQHIPKEDLQFHISYINEKSGYLLAKHVNKYLTIYLAEIKDLNSYE